MPLIIGGGAPPNKATLDVLLVADALPGATLDVLMVSDPSVPAVLDVLMLAEPTLPTAPNTDQWGVENQTVVTGLGDDVQVKELRFSGNANDTLIVVVDGLRGLDTPELTVQIISTIREPLAAPRVFRVSPRTYRAEGSEPKVDPRARTTTFEYRRGEIGSLRGARLPQYLPWHVTANPDPCLEHPRKVEISATVHGALSDHLGAVFSFEDDPLVGEYWVEGEDDISTEGMTLQALLEATYGQIGMVWWWVPAGPDVKLLICWPFPVRRVSGAQMPLPYTLSSVPERQRLHVPVQLTLRGRAHVTRVDHVKLLEWIGSDPALDELTRELQPGGEWIVDASPAGTSVVRSGFRKYDHVIVNQIEVTTDDVEAREKVGAVDIVKPFYGVAVGLKITRTLLDPYCRRRPIAQFTRTWTWAYGLGTQTSVMSLPGPGLYTNVTAGDLLAIEDTVTTMQYSLQGFLSAQTTHSRKLASVQQVDADRAPNQRGALSAYEYVSSTVTDRWEPAWGGKWWLFPGAASSLMMPAYDTVSHEAIRTMPVARATPEPPRLIDAAPARYDCQICDFRVIKDSTGVVLKSGDAGRGDPVEQTVSFLSARRLVEVGKKMFAARWTRIVTTFSVPFAYPYPVGTNVFEGRVQDVQMVVKGQRVTSTVTCTQLDDSLLSPNSVGVYDYLLPVNEGTAVGLVRAGTAMRARVVTGWAAITATPIETFNALIEFPQGEGKPGDDIAWRYINGRREATSAR